MPKKIVFGSAEDRFHHLFCRLQVLDIFFPRSLSGMGL